MTVPAIGSAANRAALLQQVTAELRGATNPAASTRATPANPSSSAPPTPANLIAPAKRETREQVRKLSHELEAVFVNQLFQAMRASVPQDPVMGNAPGAEMFTSLMDQQLASQTAERLHRGLGESLYRQLARRLPESTEGSAP